jgi:hypothetical protein
MVRTRILVGIALGVCLSVAALGDAKSVKQSKLPPAVLRTAEAQSAGATVTGYWADKVDGVTVYRMDLMADGKTRTIVMDSDGTVTSVEQQVEWSELPPDVQKNFESVSHKGKLGPVSTVSSGGEVVAYEAMLTIGNDRHRVRVKPKAQDGAAAPAASQ